jgi:predicted TIM-barrel fold metal-dependent hydrolase
MDHFEIYDAHHHVGNPNALAETSALDPDVDERELTGRLAIMDAAGVAQATVIASHVYLRPGGLADTRLVNDHIAAYRDRHPDRFPIALGILEPRDGPAGLHELDRMHAELRLDGVSFHTRLQGVSLDSEWVIRYVARIAELGMVPVLHSMSDIPEEALWKLATVARTVPDVTIVALDACSAHEGTREMHLVAEIAPNVVFDTALCATFDWLEPFASKYPDRLMFGSNLYSPPIGRRISHILAQIKESPLDDEVKAGILGGNARRVFGL